MEESIKIEKFSGFNFGLWKDSIGDILYQKDNLYLALQGVEKKPMDMKDEEWELLDRKALGVIRLSLAKSVVSNVRTETTTKGLMDALARLYETPSATNKIYLMNKLFSMKHSESISMHEHLNNFNALISQLSSVEMKFDDEMVAVAFLCTLSEDWSPVVTAVSNSVPRSEKLKFEDVTAKILSEETKRKLSGESSSSSVALNTQFRGRDRRQGRQRGKSRGKSPFRGRSQSRGPEKRECWYCGKTGHLRKDCWKKNGKPVVEKNTGEANTVGSSTEESLLASVCATISEHWVIDSGASFHTTSQKDFFL